MNTTMKKRMAALKKAQKAAQSPEARAKRRAAMLALHAAKREAKGQLPVVFAPGEKAPVIQYEGDGVKKARAKPGVRMLDKEALLKAHLAIMAKLLDL